jgi:hypothetical protein
MLLWSQQTAGHQVALHAAESSTLDSDQLAWSLGTILRFQNDFQADLAQQDFISFALRCLFKQQTNVGIWRTGARLFHYLKSGNAYCYVFETFAVLLKSALIENRKEGIFLRDVLRPYAPRLLKLWRYAISTQTPVPGEGGMAWSSGHRATSKEPESWATASVFSYAECLRRLLGIWTREEAASQFKLSTLKASSGDAIHELSMRGATWSAQGKDAATQLMTLFVNPTRSSRTTDSLEPDSQPILPNHARGAILYGPPGTSKTSLSRCVARAIDWDYIELHASDFVADGLPNVQRTANGIFERLMELDRTVVLFDEIDELVRTREKEHDAFGRFLTTSMLPKLAELWKRSKVIYFIATNHISFFDPAVIRAERFDALIHVSPPSLNRKLTQLQSLLEGMSLTVASVALTHEEVEQALQCVGKACPKKAGSGADAAKHDSDDAGSDAPLPQACVLAKFLLMRWDQLQELASIIRVRERTGLNLRLDRRALEPALAELSDPSLRHCGPFREYARAIQYEQHDFSKECVWEVRGDIPGSETAQFRKAAGSFWYVFRGAFGELENLPRACRVVAPGVLQWQG